jgi:signal transduction histidine kinase/NAD-dependent dihydropyrimidine dehydrogenase PreA subunit
MSAIVTTSKDRCRRCYSCVRRCPAKAIRVRAGQAEVIPDRCVACGRCVRVCTQNAKQVHDNLPDARRWIAQGNAVLMLAPSFAAACPPLRPGQLIAALRRAGFAGIYEVAFGADLVARVYQERYQREPGALTISTPCPAAVGYIQKFAPELLAYLSPVDSPMTAMAKVLKQRLRPGCRTIFAGPCTAKIQEARDPQVSPWVDGVLTFPELRELLATEAGGNLAELSDEDFDPPHSMTGGIFPVPKGLLRTAELPDDLLANEVSDVVGTEAFSDVVERLHQRVQNGSIGDLETRFFDVLFCRGCIAGPMMPGSESQLVRKERIVAWMRARRASVDKQQWQRDVQAYADLDLSRSFVPDGQRNAQPTEAELRAILARTGKLTPQDELNCRACGYRSCRDKARAVFNGQAEVDMCLPFIIDRLEATVDSLNRSHQDLTEAHAQLIRSERLASMGQLAAGIAHEVNNPLGTILIYSHLLADQLEAGRSPHADSLKGDVQMILGEAKRCKTIVGGLLDFARQNKVTRTLVDVGALITEAVSIVRAGREDDVRYETVVPDDLPAVWLDRDQMLQVLLNIVRNAVELMPAGGKVRVTAQHDEARAELHIAVRDTGPGIASENMQKLFTPFFTTKPVGKGTGLGLPICYGIVKMHRGTIGASNNADGPGATFEIVLPCTQEERANGGML